jgi:alanine racemase
LKTPTRPTLAEINLNALEGNLAQVRQKIGEGVAIMGVVKANAYGHGLLEIARHLQRLNVDAFGVAFPEEGAALRKGGIRKPIHVFALPTKPQCPLIARYRLEATVCSLEESQWLNVLGTKVHRTLPVNLKIDSGMNRLGLKRKQLEPYLRTLAGLKRIEVVGVFTHFATADEEDQSFARRQLDEFQAALDILRRNGIEPSRTHCANSAAIMTLKESHFSMVRPGIMLYGYAPSRALAKSASLIPVMRLSTRVALVKEIEVGESVSYARRFVASRRTRIATLPVGYADGIFRLLSGKCQVLINGRLCPVVGTICMDHLMVDVGGEDVKVGDEAVLIGQQGSARISAWDLSDRLGSIPYEICCAISARVPRSYVNS